MEASEYGAAGLVGVLPPQANSTVESELGVLLEPGVASIVSRLTCFSSDPRERLAGYFQNIGDALRAFDTAKPDVTLFACTGSTYLVGRKKERRAFASLRLPVVSAAEAVSAALDALGARRLALVSPYPAWLTELCVAYWRGEGKEIAACASPAGDRSDTRRIYLLGTPDAVAALGTLDLAGVDAVLVTGTGMPSLGAIAWHTARSGVPILSSNFCLAWYAARRLAGAPLDAESFRGWLDPRAAWRARLAARFPAAAEFSRP